MPALLRGLGLALALFAANDVVQADLFLCVDQKNHRRIQDKPCPWGQRADGHVVEKGRQSQGSPAPRSKPAATGASSSRIEVGIQRNKTVICQLLDAEKRDTEAQLRGEAKPPAGEKPGENLIKIERQRSRVGCDAS